MMGAGFALLAAPIFAFSRLEPTTSFWGFRACWSSSAWPSR